MYRVEKKLYWMKIAKQPKIKAAKAILCSRFSPIRGYG